MKVLLDIKDEKAAFVMEVLKNFKFVKSKTLVEPDSRFLEELKESIEELKLIKAGELKGTPAEEFLCEL